MSLTLKKEVNSLVDIDSLILNPKRYHLIQQIQESLAEGCSKQEAARSLGIGRHTVSKYAEGDLKMLSELGIQSNKLASSLFGTLFDLSQ